MRRRPSTTSSQSGPINTNITPHTLIALMIRSGNASPKSIDAVSMNTEASP
jgi:hypothetical protein